MESKLKEVPLSVERVPGTLSTASKSVQVNGAATVSLCFLTPVLLLLLLLFWGLVHFEVSSHRTQMTHKVLVEIVEHSVSDDFKQF